MGEETVTFKPSPGAVPPFQDLATLAWHVCMSEHTIEDLVRKGLFPPARKNKCGKRIWVWKEVERFMSAPDDDAPTSHAEIIRMATQRVSHG